MDGYLNTHSESLSAMNVPRIPLTLIAPIAFKVISLNSNVGVLENVRHKRIMRTVKMQVLKLESDGVNLFV